MPDELRDIIEQRLRDDLAAHYAEARAAQKAVETRRARLLDERAKLLQAHYADAIPVDLLRSEQQRIAAELARISKDAAAVDDRRAVAEANLRKALDLARDCHAAYLAATRPIRRLFIQAFFDKLYVIDDDVEGELRAPFNILLSTELQAGATAVARATATDGGTPRDGVLERLRRTWDRMVPGLKETGLVGRTERCADHATLGVSVAAPALSLS